MKSQRHFATLRRVVASGSQTVGPFAVRARACVVILMFVVAAFWPQLVYVQAPQVFVSDSYVEGMALHGRDLYW